VNTAAAPSSVPDVVSQAGAPSAPVLDAVAADPKATAGPAVAALRDAPQLGAAPTDALGTPNRSAADAGGTRTSGPSVAAPTSRSDAQPVSRSRNSAETASPPVVQTAAQAADRAAATSSDSVPTGFGLRALSTSNRAAALVGARVQQRNATPLQPTFVPSHVVSQVPVSGVAQPPRVDARESTGDDLPVPDPRSPGSPIAGAWSTATSGSGFGLVIGLVFLFALVAPRLGRAIRPPEGSAPSQAFRVLLERPG
jgi:hypothetical protein